METQNKKNNKKSNECDCIDCCIDYAYADQPYSEDRAKAAKEYRRNKK